MATLRKGLTPLSETHPNLVEEWDYEKNAPLTPGEVTAGSGKKAWWICSKGHSWDAQIASRVYGAGCPFCSGNRLLKGFNDLATKNPNLILEWDYGRNYPYKPEEFTAYSRQKAWWKCNRGHSWQAAIGNRNNGTSCPICGKDIRIKHRNSTIVKQNMSLGEKRPDLAKEWHPFKNGSLSPFEVTFKSSKKVWWLGDCGHEWSATVQNRSNNHGCPYCSGKLPIKGKNDLASYSNDLLDEWNYEKNAPLLPENVSCGSGRKVWWIGKCGHEWKTDVASRVKGGNCPYCSCRIFREGINDLQTADPELAKEWHPVKNGDLTPNQISRGSSKKVWWKGSCGHEWQVSVMSRRSGYGCPICSGKQVVNGETDLATINSELAQEWDYEKNTPLTPQKITAVSNKKVWWKCVYGHEWKTSVANRAAGHGCPVCARNGSSMPEQGVAFYLSKICTVNQRYKSAGLELDVYLPEYNIGIEYDGAYFHLQKERDERKNRIMKDQGVRLIRIKESNSVNVSDDTITYIPDDMGENYNDALYSLFRILKQLTGNYAFDDADIDARRDRIAIRERFNLYQKENSISAKRPALINEWHPTKNGVLVPEMFTYGSKEKVWWLCCNGHEWKASILNRYKGTGCPTCYSAKKNEHSWKAVKNIDTGVVYKSLAEASKDTGILSSGISTACKGKNKTAGGFHWKYCD